MPLLYSVACPNYLRVRGEYLQNGVQAASLQELPPRARRILGFGSWYGGQKGTTSACAENTHQRQKTPPSPGNYLRVRGEYGSGR